MIYTAKKPKKRISHPEFHLQCQVCDYLKLQYKDVLFLSDTIANVKLTIPQQVRNKRIQKDGFKCPDLLILASRVVDGERFSGLFIELKAETPYKIDGFTLKSNEHVNQQSKYLDKLSGDGYFCLFSWNFEMTKSIVDRYLRSPKE